MDQYNDLYLQDQYTADLTSVSLPSANRRFGFYEDRLRFDQYRQPASLNCYNPNPYIQDNICKSQRHQPIRTCDIPNREEIIKRTSCDPLLSGPSYPVAANQKLYYGDDCRYTLFDSDNKKEGMSGGKKNSNQNESVEKIITNKPIELDGMTLLILFIFIVLVFLCCHYWKSISDIKENLSSIKELLRVK